MPYDPSASVREQVRTSIESSLYNLRLSDESPSTDGAYIDMLILHSPLPTTHETMEAWAMLESYVPHRIRNLGISNCPLSVLKLLYNSPGITIKPAVVQNRFYRDTGFDVPLRAFCRQKELVYESFWTLSANPHLLQSDAVRLVAGKAGISLAAALYCLVIGLGQTTVLNGTTNEAHMQEDLAAPGQIEQMKSEAYELWKGALASFKLMIGERL